MSDKKYTPEQCLIEMKTIIDTVADTEAGPQQAFDIVWKLIGKLYRMVEFLYEREKP